MAVADSRARARLWKVWVVAAGVVARRDRMITRRLVEDEERGTSVRRLGWWVRYSLIDGAVGYESVRHEVAAEMVSMH